jgi:hypothetical protein
MTTGRHKGRSLDLLGEQPRTNIRNESCAAERSVAQAQVAKALDERRESHREIKDSDVQGSRRSLGDDQSESTKMLAKAVLLIVQGLLGQVCLVRGTLHIAA